jgi:hypothetical protein
LLRRAPRPRRRRLSPEFGCCSVTRRSYAFDIPWYLLTLRNVPLEAWSRCNHTRGSPQAGMWALGVLGATRSSRRS